MAGFSNNPPLPPDKVLSSVPTKEPYSVIAEPISDEEEDKTTKNAEVIQQPAYLPTVSFQTYPEYTNQNRPDEAQVIAAIKISQVDSIGESEDMELQETGTEDSEVQAITDDSKVQAAREGSEAQTAREESKVEAERQETEKLNLQVEDSEVKDPTEREDYLEVMTNMLKECKFEYEEGLQRSILEFVVGCVYSVVEDASEYSAFAKKEEIDIDDVELAIDLSRTKNKASSIIPEITSINMKQRNFLQTSNSLNASVSESAPESETASTGDVDSDGASDTQEKSNSYTMEEHDLYKREELQPMFEVPDFPSISESASTSSCDGSYADPSTSFYAGPSTSFYAGPSTSSHAGPSTSSHADTSKSDHSMDDKSDAEFFRDAESHCSKYIDLSSHRYRYLFTNEDTDHPMGGEDDQSTSGDVESPIINIDLSQIEYSDISSDSLKGPITNTDNNTSISPNEEFNSLIACLCPSGFNSTS